MVGRTEAERHRTKGVGPEQRLSVPVHTINKKVGYHTKNREVAGHTGSGRPSLSERIKDWPDPDG